MKKIITLAALTAAVFPALAASNVTLYGLIDDSVQVSKAQKDAAVVDLFSGFTAMSRWGVKGTEDLGNGYKVGFILEQGFLSDDGAEKTAGKAFSREANLSVEGPFGKLTFGRFGTLGFGTSTAIVKGGVFGVTHGAYGFSSSATGNLTFAYVDNAIAYRTPKFNGFSLHAMYSNQKSGDDSENKWSKNNHYYGLGLLYAAKDLSGSIIFEAVDNKGEIGKKYEGDPLYHITAGGWWQIGKFRPMAIYQYQYGKNQRKQHAAQVGTWFNVAGGTAKLGVKYINRKVEGNGAKINKKTKADVWNLGAKYQYDLSKRTQVYGFAGYSFGGKGWNTGSALKDAAYNGYLLATGMVHKF